MTSPTGTTGARRGEPGARRRPPRGPLAALAAGVALLLVAGAVAWSGRPTPDVGAQESIRLGTPAGSSTPAGQSTQAGQSTPAAGVPVRPGALPPPVSPVPPSRVSIAAIDVDARVDPVGIAGGRLFEVPRSVDRVGWYRFGPGLEARTGSVVVAGHVDGRTQGRGAFYRLRELDRGDRLTVTGADGRVRAYRVVARESFTKNVLPVERLFARDGAHRLTLITCGGPFDRDTRTYRDNLVVTAVPA